MLRREYNGSFAVVSVLILLDSLGRVVRETTSLVDSMWALLLQASLGVWATLRTLKRKIKWLAVKGR